jgi:hypothetical protein
LGYLFKKQNNLVTLAARLPWCAQSRITLQKRRRVSQTRFFKTGTLLKGGYCQGDQMRLKKIAHDGDQSIFLVKINTWLLQPKKVAQLFPARSL